MGLDLYLLPFDCDNPGISFAHTLLSCQRRGDLFDVLSTLLGATPVPDDFTSFLGYHPAPCGEYGYGHTYEDPYGSSLRALTVAQLLTVSTHDGVQDNHKNRAIWAYLAELPPETRVALFWH